MIEMYIGRMKAKEKPTRVLRCPTHKYAESKKKVLEELKKEGII
jgi:hypothetical protein